MNATTRPLARIAGVAIVLILAAALGLMAGNVLNARDAGPAGGPGPFPNVWGNHADITTAAGAPTYADPYRRSSSRPRPTTPSRSPPTGATSPTTARAGAPTYADPYRQIIQQAAATDADPVTSESWGNIAETSRGESLTAPTPR